MQLPLSIPIFPLPDHVLLPAIPTAYRIFEPRYRALVVDLQSQPGRCAMAGDTGSCARAGRRITKAGHHFMPSMRRRLGAAHCR